MPASIPEDSPTVRAPGTGALAHWPPVARAALLAGVTAAGVVALLALTEAGLRLEARQRNGFTHIDEVFTIDPATGLRVPRPSTRYGHIAINRLGFRGPEIEVPKPPGRLRLAFVGASTTFCADVSGDDKTWPHEVARALAARHPARSVDYVNAAVPGYGLEAMHQSLVRRVLPMQPDVIVVYEAANSIATDTLRLARERGAVEERAPLSRWLTDRFRLAQLVHMNAAAWAISSQERRGVRRRLDLGPGDLAALRDSYRDRLASLIRSGQEAGALVAVATFSQRIRASNAPPEESAEGAWALSRSRATHLSVRGLVAAHEAYNEAIRQAAAVTGALLIEGEDEIPADAAHFVDTMHFTDMGAEAMARRVVRALAVKLDP